MMSKYDGKDAVVCIRTIIKSAEKMTGILGHPKASIISYINIPIVKDRGTSRISDFHPRCEDDRVGSGVVTTLQLGRSGRERGDRRPFAALWVTSLCTRTLCSCVRSRPGTS